MVNLKRNLKKNITLKRVIKEIKDDIYFPENLPVNVNMSGVYVNIAPTISLRNFKGEKLFKQFLLIEYLMEAY